MSKGCIFKLVFFPDVMCDIECNMIRKSVSGLNGLQGNVLVMLQYCSILCL